MAVFSASNTVEMSIVQDLNVWPNFLHLGHCSERFWEAITGWLLIIIRWKTSCVFTLMEHCRDRAAVPDLNYLICLFHDSPDCSEYLAIGATSVRMNSSHECAHIWWTLGLIIAHGKDCLCWTIRPYPSSFTLLGIAVIDGSTFWVIDNILLKYPSRISNASLSAVLLIRLQIS